MSSLLPGACSDDPEPEVLNCWTLTEPQHPPPPPVVLLSLSYLSPLSRKAHFLSPPYWQGMWWHFVVCACVCVYTHYDNYLLFTKTNTQISSQPHLRSCPAIFFPAGTKSTVVVCEVFFEMLCFSSFSIFFWFCFPLVYSPGSLPLRGTSVCTTWPLCSPLTMLEANANVSINSRGKLQEVAYNQSRVYLEPGYTTPLFTSLSPPLCVF